MKGEIITVGNELLSGLVTDTNSAYIAGRLMTVGVRIVFMTTVGDDEGAIVDAVKRGLERAEAIVVTGGLGPTPDDITSRGIAKALERQLVLSPEAQEQIRNRYKKRGIQLSADADRQALIPHGARVITNPVGTAPGYWVKLAAARIFVVPGVPEEMRVMTDQGIVPILQAESGPGVFFTRRVLHIFGLSESQVYERLKGVPYSPKGVTIGFLPVFPENHLTVTAQSHVSKDDAQRIASEVEATVRGALGNTIFGADDQTLEGVVGGMLIGGKVTVSTAESCTGGLLAQRLTDHSGKLRLFSQGGGDLQQRVQDGRPGRVSRPHRGAWRREHRGRRGHGPRY